MQNQENRSSGQPANQNDKGASTNRNVQGDDLPGYPHYPANEDIMNPGNGAVKIGTDVEALANSRRLSGIALAAEVSAKAVTSDEQYDDLGIVKGTEADLTKDDLIILGEADKDMDLGEDEDADKARVDNIDNEELDIPGAELDDDSEAIGEEDEENNYYSLGGDRHDDLEEDQS